MRGTVGLAALLFLGSMLAGCVGDGADSGTTGDGLSDDGVDDVTKAKGPVRVVTAPPVEDRRFGDDRPLTFEDLPDLLPDAQLTGYNITRDYFLSMVPNDEFALYEVRTTVNGRLVFGVLVNDDAVFHPERPTVFLTCSQHGNEPSGSEACLIMIEYFVHGVDEYAQRIRNETNVVMLPLANPDGKEANQRANYDGADINRDHMDMVTLEGRAIHDFYNLYDPEVILDLHEFGGRGNQHPLYPTVPVSTYDYFEVAAPQTFYNHDEEMLAANYEIEALIIQTMWDKHGIASASHYPSTNSVSSIQRNHYGMHNSISLLFETGGGRNEINIDLRTQLQLDASFTVFDWILGDPARIKALEAGADSRSSTPESGIQGWLVPEQGDDSLKLMDFLDIHNVSYEKLDGDASYTVTHYEAGVDTPPQDMSFENGTLLISRWQADGLVAHEIFEAQHDDYYDHGPRDWGIDVWRILET